MTANTMTTRTSMNPITDPITIPVIAPPDNPNWCSNKLTCINNFYACMHACLPKLCAAFNKTVFPR